ncbi:hypothetical protein [Pseudomonas tohonis]|uniref:hypothetical protein n=1 Tax=Pseudomonas tohonis TaxID=2725477 RepID=UPI001F1EF271|nr:hypothetical protein [Pseudomonas tohonis]
MRHPSIVYHDAVKSVTGSCCQLQNALLIDCVLFQGAETSPERWARGSRLAIDFSLVDIKTHIHIDHLGRIPDLLAVGFKGPILCGELSAKLLLIAFKLDFRCDQKQLKRYFKLIEQRIVALPYKQWSA